MKINLRKIFFFNILIFMSIKVNAQRGTRVGYIDMNIIKKEAGLQPGLASCHTAFVDGYVIEGHVPASDIKRILTQKPAVLGLTAPGMPQKSPGMQPEGSAPQGFDVLAFDKSGQTTVFKRY